MFRDEAEFSESMPSSAKTLAHESPVRNRDHNTRDYNTRDYKNNQFKSNVLFAP